MQLEFKAADAAQARALRRDRANQLLAALYALGGDHGALLRHEERAWASITFAGARHTLAFRFAGDVGVAAGEAFVAALPEHEFAIPHRLVADATVVAVRHALIPEPAMEVECEVLMLEQD
jgi:hypothetical protein